MAIRKSKSSLMTITAMLMALTTLATFFFKIPVGPGYIHLGDTFVILAALILPRKYACFAGGAGAALADLLGGFAAWAPWSLAIKAATVLVVAAVAGAGAADSSTAPIAVRGGITNAAQGNAHSDTNGGITNAAQGNAHSDTNGGISNAAQGLGARLILSFVLAGILGAAGYFFAEGVMYGNWTAPLVSIPFNLLQIAVGAVLSTFIFRVYSRATR